MREQTAFAGLMGFVVLFRFGLVEWRPPAAVFLNGHGVSAFVVKMILQNLHIPERHFVALNLVDTLLWALTGFYRFQDADTSSEMFCYLGIVLGLPLLMASGLRQLSIRTLADAEKEVQQREHAEQSRDFFLSYLMYEMRNPLSGASLLLYEFLESLKDLAKNMKNKGFSAERLRSLTRKEVNRLLRLASVMVTQIDKMRGVCDDVLQLEKIQKGKFEYLFNPIRVEDWVEKVAFQTAPLFAPPTALEDASTPLHGPCSLGTDANEGVNFTWAINITPAVQTLLSSLPVGVADFARLEQVISNFVSNAKKFTHTGRVSLHFNFSLPEEVGEAELESVCLESKQKSRALDLIMCEKGTGEKDPSPSAEDPPMDWVALRVSVADSGAGLSDEDMGNLFKPYGQVRAGELQNGGGTGLGLCICKSFVEAHAGGRIGVESPGRGKGCTFFFQIFIPLLDATNAPSSIGYQVSSDFDLPAAACHMSTAERRESIFSLLSSTPEAAQEMVTPPNILFIPAFEESAASGRSGMSAVSQMKCKPKLSDCTPDTRAPDTPPCLSLGSPVTQKNSMPSSDHFDSVFSQLQRADDPDDTIPVTPVVPPARLTPSSADVLLVDDDRFCLMAGSAAIRRLGYSVCTAEDGEEACGLIISQKFSFRFILIDKNMPRMEGPETVRKLVSFFSSAQTKREARQHQSPDGGDPGCLCDCPLTDSQTPPPVILGCTGDATPESRELFLQAGAHRVIFKPLQPSQLAETLKELEKEFPQRTKRKEDEMQKEQKEEAEKSEENISKEETEGEDGSPDRALPIPFPPVSPAVSTARNSPSSADVLLVDDDRFCLMAGSAAIRRLGYSVCTAEDGEEACDLIISQKFSFRFILIDSQMPRMNGREAVEHLSAFFKKGTSEGEGDMRSHFPVIVGCTGDSTEESRNRFLEAGAAHVLHKPLQPSHLAETLHSLERAAEMVNGLANM
uniref:histidine kinase n=1 Tax=Chromera velia CCMP2878 TaxID=1169474 RepID=A0A0G4HTR8_9ALVE|eukprot:Cvel_8519.t1-p1 / transcript=Cvel_8519.t1 / gene=Cvel_8519 / organism=Chromera_velia_CCMP2878 / gene_product=Ethylene receptor 1, putative / transcript_product=Ethylene receptor 1, putative / location=Cvel_scaffold471:73741-76779(+) / protein_length=962 / sequence_SO=supercontig / SO=protein_coding / is_pseudo=false